MAFLTTDLPQANNLDKVIQTVEAVSLGAKTDQDIANYIGFTARQGRYYRHAAVMLYFITNQDNFAVLTDMGAKLLNSDNSEKKYLLQLAILDNEFFNSIIEYTKEANEGLTKSEIENFIYSNTIDPSLSTIERRLSTLLQWLIDPKIELLKKNGDKYQYNPTLIVDDSDTKDSDYYERTDSETPSIYPIDTYDFELDIREEHHTVFGLYRKILQGKIKMDPEFQRNFVWKNKQKSQFIESLIINIPLPPIYVSQDNDGNFVIVDGLQRTHTLKSFIEGDLRLEGLEAIPKLNDLTFNDLPIELKTRIEDKNLLLYILKPSVPLVVVYDIFNRINTGGTKLERQEVRNCIYIGESTRLLKELVEEDAFKIAIDYGISPNRMKDREAVLRYLAFKIYDYKSEYQNDMDEFLSQAMKKINSMTKKEIKNLKIDFLRSMRLSYEFFGTDNFRLPTEFSRGRINIAIFESISYFFSNESEEYLYSNKEKIIDNYRNLLLKDQNYLDSVRFSTGTTSKVRNRFLLVQQILKKQTNHDLKIDFKEL
jgi:hypothetical protein